MKVTVGIVGYREWAYDIYYALRYIDLANLTSFGVEFNWITLSNNSNKKNASFVINDPQDTRALLNYIRYKNYDIIIFAGWSWIVTNEILEATNCLCIHPSDIFKFRGGSPIQNQMLRGIDEAELTIFKMTEQLDWGPVLNCKNIRLDGYIPEIFDRIVDASVVSIREIVTGYFSGINPCQVQISGTPGEIFSRRKPNDGIIKSDLIKKYNFDYIDRLTRCLTGPYPRLRIEIPDANKRYFEVSSVMKLNQKTMKLGKFSDEKRTRKGEISKLFECADAYFIACGVYNDD